MWWCIALFVVIGLVLFLVASASPASRESRRLGLSLSWEDKEKAQEIADKVDSLAKFKVLEKRLDRAMDSDGVSRRSDILELAYSIAEKKPFRWQYVPDITPDTPLRQLKLAYKVYTPARYEEAKAKLGADGWDPICGEDEPDEPEENLALLLAFRKIVESKLKQTTQVKKINDLFAKYPEEASCHFDLDGDLTPGDRWFAERLREDGAPLSFDLYAEGYTSPERYLDIDAEAFRERKGVGPKTVEKLLAYQEHVRCNQSNDESDEPLRQPTSEQAKR